MGEGSWEQEGVREKGVLRRVEELERGLGPFRFLNERAEFAIGKGIRMSWHRCFQ
ncbi:hypothetical protein COLO4_07621 [Corchorus olitorius]|uniref:Uncharacterized protein n=1 Tax=Corchorus olitorius TaxID=93759 RepID=A0A1R3KJE1_9ROSI|nr:hypothetical protein COLO4_07621 [Corchorus olitorius]